MGQSVGLHIGHRETPETMAFCLAVISPTNLLRVSLFLHTGLSFIVWSCIAKGEPPNQWMKSMFLLFQEIFQGSPCSLIHLHLLLLPTVLRRMLPLCSPSHRQLTIRGAQRCERSPPLPLRGGGRGWGIPWSESGRSSGKILNLHQIIE